MTGIHWGNRHLLAFYPLAAVLAVRTLVRWWSDAPQLWRGWGSTCVAFLLVVSVAAQVLSVNLLARKQAYSAAANRAIRDLPSRVIVTDVWWVPQEFFSVFHDRMMFYVEKPAQLNAIRPRLQAMGIQDFLFTWGKNVPQGWGRGSGSFMRESEEGQGDAEAAGVAPAVGPALVPKRGAAVLGVVAPTPTPPHAPQHRRHMRTVCRQRGGHLVPIQTPFTYVPVHVIQTPSVRQIRPHVQGRPGTKRTLQLRRL